MEKDNKKFDIHEFNKNFDKYKEGLKQDQSLKEADRLAELNKAPLPKKFYEFNMIELLIGIKDTWFEILDDMLSLRFRSDILTKNNRAFFIGLTILIICLIVYIFNIFSNDDEIKEQKNITEIHNFYYNKLIDNVTDNVTDKPSNKLIDNVTDNVTDKPSDKPSDNVTDKI
jgi:hypothetical protein